MGPEAILTQVLLWSDCCARRAMAGMGRTWLGATSVGPCYVLCMSSARPDRDGRGHHRPMCQHRGFCTIKWMAPCWRVKRRPMLVVDLIHFFFLATRRTCKPPDMIRCIESPKASMCPRCNRCRSFRRDMTRTVGASAEPYCVSHARGFLVIERYCHSKYGICGVARPGPASKLVICRAGLQGVTGVVVPSCEGSV